MASFKRVYSTNASVSAPRNFKVCLVLERQSECDALPREGAGSTNPMDVHIVNGFAVLHVSLISQAGEGSSWPLAYF